MKNKGAKQRSKKKRSENAFGCDLTEHLQNSGQDVPQVLKTCAEFIEKHGVVDGIYRLSGVTSNIQRLRQEFCAELCPDLTKDMYLQDIHCVGSLCKLYFRELPNPLLTYELYKKFTEAVSVQEDHERLQHIQDVIKELPLPHFRTLEYLTKHLAHLATLSPQTNMHSRNLALVWAPNLLRSKDIEVASCNGDMAFLEVRVQQSVVEFILNHTEQIFNHAAAPITPKGPSLMCGEKYATLPISGQGGPMKLMSLEEAQARSLSPNHPARKERQRENSLPDTSTATLYHTVIDISESKRKLSGKSKTWKSIFNLGKSVTDSKGKLSRNGSVFLRAQNITEKAAIRPARSMDSLCSLPTGGAEYDDKAGHFNSVGEANGFFAPGIKSRTLESDSLYDLSEHQRWEFEIKKSSEATGGSSPNMKRRGSPSVSPPQQKSLPEQLKVFKGDDLSSCQPTSPKNRRMLYSGSTHSSTSRPSFPGSLFPESSPRHQRKALNISEPFAVSVPLRVSAVISSNSTPCRATGKERPAAAALKPSRETSQSEQSDSSGSSSYREHPLVESSVGKPSLHSTQQSQVTKHLQPGDDITYIGMSVAEKGKEPSWKSKSQDWVKGVFHDDGKNALSVVMGGIERLSICLEERPHTLGLPHQDDEDGCGGHSELEDLEEEPWEEVFSSTKQWVTSPLHSPTFKDLFGKLDVSSSCSVGEGLSSKDLNGPPQSREDKPTNESCPVRSIEVFQGNSSLASSVKTETKITHPLPLPAKTTVVSDDATRPHRGNSCTAKQKNTTSSQRFHRQTSYEACYSEKTVQDSFSKHRPYSLNLDLGLRCIRDISNQQNLELAELSSIQRGAVTPSGTKSNGLSQELELFLSDRQAPVRRNSAPVSVSSVRTAFMIKTCQAKAVPVIPPKVQYSHIPHPTNNDAGNEAEKELTKTRGEKLDTVPLLPSIRDLKEELENKEPAPKSQIRQAIAEKSTETNKNTPISDPPVLRRKRSSNAEAFTDCPKPERSTVLQRPSFRNRQRPQSLILFSPPFPIMDYPPLGDDGKLLLSPIRSPTETSALNVFSKEMAENLRTPEGVTLRNKMTIPKSGQRLETSTSCFYQPQRRSMIFDNRSHRQIE
uniref:Rho GTPase activating protein 31 n=1 Tax=Hucho hucho TaxID=62062 RepID=A0A4W5LDB9_9TELE